MNDYVTNLEKKIVELITKVEKLKGLILLTDPVVSDVQVSSTQATQWNEFINRFPEEGRLK